MIPRQDSANICLILRTGLEHTETQERMMETRAREGLFAALDQALPDPLGQRWAVAETVGRDWVAVRGADGRMIVEERWQHRGYRYRERKRLEQIPSSLRWRPVACWRAPEWITEQETQDERSATKRTGGAGRDAA
jgi:hypothetical protein